MNEKWISWKRACEPTRQSTGQKSYYSLCLFSVQLWVFCSMYVWLCDSFNEVENLFVSIKMTMLSWAIPIFHSFYRLSLSEANFIVFQPPSNFNCSFALAEELHRRNRSIKEKISKQENQISSLFLTTQILIHYTTCLQLTCAGFLLLHLHHFVSKFNLIIVNISFES